MIEKSRLEELIKECATVYYADRDVLFPIPIFLNKDFMIKGKELSHKENCLKGNTLLEDLYETEEDAETKLKKKKKCLFKEKNTRIEEGENVWFVDCIRDNQGNLKWYAEKGKVEAIKNNGDYIISFYFGMSVLQKDEAFKTKEECENYISLYQENEYYED